MITNLTQMFNLVTILFLPYTDIVFLCMFLIVVHEFGEPEVRDLGRVVVPDQHVPGRQVTVHHLQTPHIRPLGCPNYYSLSVIRRRTDRQENTSCCQVTMYTYSLNAHSFDPLVPPTLEFIKLNIAIDQTDRQIH